MAVHKAQADIGRNKIIKKKGYAIIWKILNLDMLQKSPLLFVNLQNTHSQVSDYFFLIFVLEFRPKWPMLEGRRVELSRYEIDRLTRLQEMLEQHTTYFHDESVMVACQD